MSLLPDIQELLINQNNTIRDALVSIDTTAQGICFIVDEKGKLVGVLTDGDIRRLLLANTNIDTPVNEVMKTSFLTLPVTTPVETIQKSLSSVISHIPLVDENFMPVDYACYRRSHRIPVLEPVLNGNELAYVTDCIKTGWISSQGSYVKKFEQLFADYSGVSYALAVSNGTVALHLALVALGIKEGDEVIVPDLTFAASINAVLYTGATPVIVDVDKDTWTIDIDSVKKVLSPKTKAIMPVHLYGHPCHMDELMEIAQKNNIALVEDCAEAIGSLYKGKHVGSFGEVSTFSFFGNKTITTGEGGMILFRNKEHYEKALILRDHGMSKEKRYWHEHIGFNYRLTNVQAAIGVAQMERVESFVEAKRKMSMLYSSFLVEEKDIITPPEKEWAKNSYWLYTLLLEKSNVSRDELIQKLLKNGIESRPVFYPLHQMPPYIKFAFEKSEYKNSIHISEKGISLPSSVSITEEEIKNICKIVKSILDTKKMNT